MDPLSQIGYQTFSSVDSTGPSIAGVVLECNKVAMEHLRNDNFSAALDLLKKAEQLLTFEYQQNPSEKIYHLIGITLNNLGCYYKRDEKPKVALKYLKKALQIETVTVNDQCNLAGTHLNICAIFSYMKNHEAALEHVNLALDILDKTRRSLLMNEKGEYVIDPDQVQNSKQLEEVDYTKSDRYRTIVTTMIIGHFNCGTELEHLRRYHLSVQAYSKGHQLAQNELGETHPLTQNLEQSVQSLIAKKRVFEDTLEKKNTHKLKLFEANQGIRYQNMRQQRFQLHQEYPATKKVVEYDFDGHKHIKARILSHVLAEKKSAALRRERLLKLPKISKGFDADKTTRVGANNSRETNQSTIQERDHESFEQHLRGYYDALFTPSTSKVDAKNKTRHLASLSPQTRDDQATLKAKPSRPNRRNLNKTVDYGLQDGNSNDESFFKNIDHQLKDLDDKIHRTKNDISTISNHDTGNRTLPFTNPLPPNERVTINTMATTPKIDGLIGYGRTSSRGRPPILTTKYSNGIRPDSVGSSKNSSNGFDQFLKNGQTSFSFHQNENRESSSRGSGVNGGIKISGEDREPSRPSSKQGRLQPISRPSNDDSVDRHDSALFDIAQEIEKKTGKSGPETRKAAHIFIGEVKEETIEESKDHESSRFLMESKNTQVSRRTPSHPSEGTGRNSRRSSSRSKKEPKSIDEQLVDAQKSLDAYKKNIKPSIDLLAPPRAVQSQENTRSQATPKSLINENPNNSKSSDLPTPTPTNNKPADGKVSDYLKYFE